MPAMVQEETACDIWLWLAFRRVLSPSAPSGTVSFSADVSSSAFASCTLGGASTDPLTGAVSTSCAVSYTPTVAGTHTITASYCGDTSHLGSSGAFVVTALKHETSTEVSCTPAFFFNDTATTEIYTLSLHDALPISAPSGTVSFSADVASTAFASCTLGGASTDPLTGAVSTSCAVSYIPTVVGPDRKSVV